MDTHKTSKLINSLTLNEDLRQDLWVAYLSGTPANQLPQKAIESLITSDIQSQDFAAYELSLLELPQELLNSLTDEEKLVMFLLYLGYNIGEVSVLLGESRVVVLELISSVKQNEAWEKFEWHSSSVVNVGRKKM